MQRIIPSIGGEKASVPMSAKGSRFFLVLKLIVGFVALGLLANDFVVITVIAAVFAVVGGSVYLIGESLGRDGYDRPEEAAQNPSPSPSQEVE